MTKQQSFYNIKLSTAPEQLANITEERDHEEFVLPIYSNAGKGSGLFLWA